MQDAPDSMLANAVLPGEIILSDLARKVLNDNGQPFGVGQLRIAVVLAAGSALGMLTERIAITRQSIFGMTIPVMLSASLRKADAGSMQHLSAGCLIVQVVAAIVRFHAVLVVRRMTFGTRADESRRNDLMNESALYLHSSRQSNPEIALNCLRLQQGPSFVGLIGGTSYASKVAYIVQRFIVQHWEPAFIWYFGWIKDNLLSSHAVQAPILNGLVRAGGC